MTPSSSQTSTLGYFKWSFIVTVIGLALGVWLGWNTSGTLGGMATVFFICTVLAVLEISLSFDNAIVNANKLKDMTPVWQQRFLTWGILIAVFGMRIVFPLLIVVIAAGIGPIDAVILAAARPDEYARIMNDAHLPIAAFGGTFLMMVGLSYFFDPDKDVHWIEFLERRLSAAAAIKGIEIAFVLILILGFSRLLEGENVSLFVHSALYGLVTFLIVEVIGGLLDASQKTMSAAAKGGLGAFIYLEVLDASFSFDGVIGAFALTQNLFIIAIGLGIGAMYVRSMTIMLVEKGTLAHYRYLEHGAFYAILILSVIMYVQTLVHIPEVITGLGGAALIGISLWSSIRYNRQNAGADAAHGQSPGHGHAQGAVGHAAEIKA
ncbi:hypothetical protein BJF93_15240 [Xaviernesmea oryzae]|uniref:DUF475 domain-containing protein n=1 Tax=Xaviernesmea oryzae TaxID=464029 RepID=A0A1Q9AXZ7_9HYPH|nr:DUF475 domain-containing protein [Xaviernesmea oryzae]OLP60311.1 hypothetical protein BJF93_15240 [Xaviernesmea oryzae]SEK23828.1 hypothetical protein SAMN04487976_101171 [Xaviernesmea oryzae]